MIENILGSVGQLKMPRTGIQQGKYARESIVFLSFIIRIRRDIVNGTTLLSSLPADCNPASDPSHRCTPATLPRCVIGDVAKAIDDKQLCVGRSRAWRDVASQKATERRSGETTPSNVVLISSSPCTVLTRASRASATTNPFSLSFTTNAPSTTRSSMGRSCKGSQPFVPVALGVAAAVLCIAVPVGEIRSVGATEATAVAISVAGIGVEPTLAGCAAHPTRVSANMTFTTVL